MKQIILDPEKFEAKLNTVTRFWDEDAKEGLADNQAPQELKDSCTFIFVRDDGWSIASPYYGPAYRLWQGSWAYCYELADPTQEPTSAERDFLDRQSDASGMIYSDADPGL